MNAKPSEIFPQAMFTGNPCAQKIKSQPPSFILKICLVFQIRGGIDFSEIFSLDKFCIWVDFPDDLHCQYNGFGLVEHHPCKAQIVRSVRVPMAIQAAESCGSQWFIDGCIIVEKGK